MHSTHHRPAQPTAGFLRALCAPLLALCLMALGACGSLPRVERDSRSAEAIPLSESTVLGRIANAYRPAPDHSGFRLMPLGSFSLDTRVQLAQRA